MGLKTWKKWTDWPLMVLSVVFLVVYSWEILSRTHIALCETVINVIWVVFVVDYVVSLWLADDRWQWFKHNLFTIHEASVAVTIPINAMPVNISTTAMILPWKVTGEKSPYPTVVTVTNAHHNAVPRGSWIRSIWRRIGARTLGRRKWPRKPRKRLLRHQPIPKSTYCARKCVS